MSFKRELVNADPNQSQRAFKEQRFYSLHGSEMLQSAGGKRRAIG